MNTHALDRLAVRLGAASSRRIFVIRLAKTGAAVAATAALGRARHGAAQTCAYGPNTCQQGYVWREAFAGDVVCVDPGQRDQAYADNAAAGRVDSSGVYGPNTCVAGYVWREAYPGDVVCVEPWVRDQVAYDNSQAPYRIEPGCGDVTGTGEITSAGCGGVASAGIDENGNVVLGDVEPTGECLNTGTGVGDDVADNLDPYGGDSDGDGIGDLDEQGTYGTDPYSVDSDGDGQGDNLEIFGCGSSITGDPLDPGVQAPCLH